MRFAIWQTVDFSDCALGYRPGALMEQVWEGRLDWFSTDMSANQVFDRIWHEFQRVDEDHMPPEGYEGRSLSIGDVVQLVAEDEEAVETWWTPGSPVGWVQVAPIENMACPDCHGEWPVETNECPTCGLTIEEIGERLVPR